MLVEEGWMPQTLAYHNLRVCHTATYTGWVTVCLTLPRGTHDFDAGVVLCINGAAFPVGIHCCVALKNATLDGHACLVQGMNGATIVGVIGNKPAIMYSSSCLVMYS